MRAAVCLHRSGRMRDCYGRNGCVGTRIYALRRKMSGRYARRVVDGESVVRKRLK
jgi:hypothetical protein